MRRSAHFRAVVLENGRPRKGPWRLRPSEAFLDARGMPGAVVQRVEPGSPVKITILTEPTAAPTLRA